MASGNQQKPSYQSYKNLNSKEIRKNDSGSQYTSIQQPHYPQYEAQHIPVQSPYGQQSIPLLNSQNFGQLNMNPFYQSNVQSFQNIQHYNDGQPVNNMYNPDLNNYLILYNSLLNNGNLLINQNQMANSGFIPQSYPMQNTPYSTQHQYADPKINQTSDPSTKYNEISHHIKNLQTLNQKEKSLFKKRTRYNNNENIKQILQLYSDNNTLINRENESTVLEDKNDPHKKQKIVDKEEIKYSNKADGDLNIRIYENEDNLEKIHTISESIDEKKEITGLHTSQSQIVVQDLRLNSEDKEFDDKENNKTKSPIELKTHLSLETQHNDEQDRIESNTEKNLSNPSSDPIETNISSPNGIDNEDPSKTNQEIDDKENSNDPNISHEDSQETVVETQKDLTTEVVKKAIHYPLKTNQAALSSPLQPIVAYVHNCNIPRSIRQHWCDKYFKLFVQYYGGFESGEAALDALEYEEDVYKKCSTVLAYRTISFQSFKSLKKELASN